MDINAINRAGWDKAAAGNANEWCRPVDAETIARARAGAWSVILTPTVPVPSDWFGPEGVAGKRVLCLASGGGQQAPVLAAAGAVVTSFDQSGEMLGLDAQVALREGLDIAQEQGDMADLSRFADGSFDLIFNPVSNCFCPDIEPVWRECRRVLVPGGRLLTACMNPDYYLFDQDEVEAGGPMLVRHKLPYADVTSLPKERVEKMIAEGDVLDFGHTLDQQIGAQLKAGFMMAGFFEDYWDPEIAPLGGYMPPCFAMLSIAA